MNPNCVRASKICPRREIITCSLRLFPVVIANSEWIYGRLTRAILVLSLCVAMPAQTSSGRGLRIIPMEGDGAINNVAAHTAHDPVIKVVNGAGQPVAGAVVTFSLPASGPGASFLDGKPSLTASSDAEGVVRARNLTPNKMTGQFPIRITATANGETARMTIFQTNAASTAAGSARKKIVITSVIAGAVAGGVLAATRGKSAAAASTSSVVPGSPTFVPPR